MAEFFSVPGNSAGPHTAAVTKLLLHTTEGSSIEGAIGAYRTNNSWPHKTIDARFGRPYRVCTHLGFNVAARSLRNEAGGVQTNTAGVIQYEVVGQAADPGAIDWVWVAANILGPDARALGVPAQSTVTWRPYPASYGTGASQRLSGSAWLAYRGVLGHQHCPENSHGDPGAVPIGPMLAAMGTAPPPPPPSTLLEDEDMPYMTQSPHTGIWFHDGAGASWISNIATAQKFLGQGVKIYDLGSDEADARRLVESRNTGTDEAILEQAKQQAMYLSSLNTNIADIEADLADEEPAPPVEEPPAPSGN